MASQYLSMGSTANLLRVYDLATSDQIDRGIRWYEHAHNWVQHTATCFELPFHIVAAITAALSVNNKWEWNKRDVVYLLNQIRSGNRDPRKMNITTFKQQIWTAIGIYDYQDATLLSGQKVVQFYNDIMNPMQVNEEVVTVDIWAYRAWVFNSKSKVPTLHANLYNTISADYLKGAEELDLLPREFQAVVWLVVRNAGRGKQCKLRYLEAQYELPLSYRSNIYNAKIQEYGTTLSS